MRGQQTLVSITRQFNPDDANRRPRSDDSDEPVLRSALTAAGAARVGKQSPTRPAAISMYFPLRAMTAGSTDASAPRNSPSASSLTAQSVDRHPKAAPGSVTRCIRRHSSLERRPWLRSVRRTTSPRLLRGCLVVLHRSSYAKVSPGSRSRRVVDKCHRYRRRDVDGRWERCHISARFLDATIARGFHASGPSPSFLLSTPQAVRS